MCGGDGEDGRSLFFCLHEASSSERDSLSVVVMVVVVALFPHLIPQRETPRFLIVPGGDGGGGRSLFLSLSP